MDTLDLSTIESLLELDNSRGKYKAFIEDFNNSEDLVVNVTDVTRFKLSRTGEKMTAQSLLQSFNNNIEKLKLKDSIAVRKNGDNVFLIHVARYKAAKAAAE